MVAFECLVKGQYGVLQYYLTKTLIIPNHHSSYFCSFCHSPLLRSVSVLVLFKSRTYQHISIRMGERDVENITPKQLHKNIALFWHIMYAVYMKKLIMQSYPNKCNFSIQKIHSSQINPMKNINTISPVRKTFEALQRQQ